MQTTPSREPRTAILALTAFLAILVILSPSPAAAQGGPPNWPPELKNLQIFSPDTPPAELIDKMKGFTAALGVRCQFCHVGEEGQPIFTFDFASDEKPEKEAARLMLRMVQSINEDHLSKLEGDEPVLEVQCITCHRGTAHPEQLHDLLVRVATTDGANAAVAKYAELRERHYGGQSYDFAEQTLVRAAGMLAVKGDVETASSLIQLNLEHFPESAMTFGALAQLRQLQGDNEAAIVALKKVLELEPENGRVQAMLQELQELQKAQEIEQMEGSEEESGEPKR
ncbi:MAG: c-type cytochrome [Acidobacteriota bacterium]|nr:c-type cytochrome [Acidobacteriota bacterium]